MRLQFARFDLKLARRWTIASNLERGGKDFSPVVFVKITSSDGLCGWGEAAPSRRYLETFETVLEFLSRVEARRLSFDDPEGSAAYLDSLPGPGMSAKAAINAGLLDGAARSRGLPLFDFLGLGFEEGKRPTSFSVGMDTLEVMREKFLEARHFPVLKLKVGGPDDLAMLRLLRDLMPRKPVRLDANEAWKTREEALRQLEGLAAAGGIEFVEQPMPAGTAPADLAWLRERSPLPLYADESFHQAQDAALCRDCFDGVNVKLMKSGSVLAALHSLRAARQAGLKTMIGCMIESSLAISAAAHLANAADCLDLDGNILVTNDPFDGVRTEQGILSFNAVRARGGLCAEPGAGPLL